MGCRRLAVTVGQGLVLVGHEFGGLRFDQVSRVARGSSGTGGVLARRRTISPWSAARRPRKRPQIP